MYLEAVTVCIGYADFLREAMPFNLPLLDRWLIVTSPEDAETRRLCRERSLECLVTDDAKRTGFDKARCIDRGMAVLSWRGWVLHIDADIIMPPHTRNTLGSLDLDTGCLYGCDRVMVNGADRWRRLKDSGFLHTYSRSYSYNVCLPGNFDVGARWADPAHGYVPIGFWQLCHHDAVMDQGVRVRRYTAGGHSDAARTDVQFGLQWDRRHRVLIPELVVMHLGNGGEVGVNWNGRKTPPFVEAAGGPGAGGPA